MCFFKESSSSTISSIRRARHISRCGGSWNRREMMKGQRSSSNRSSRSSSSRSSSGSSSAGGAGSSVPSSLLREERREEEAAEHTFWREEGATTVTWDVQEVTMAASAAYSIENAAEEVGLSWTEAAATTGGPADVWRREEARTARAGETDEEAAAIPSERGWPPASATLTGGRDATSGASAAQAVAAAAPVEDSPLGPSEAMPAAAGTVTTPADALAVMASAGATAYPTGCVPVAAAAGAARVPRGVSQGECLMASGTVWRDTSEITNMISASLARHSNTAGEQSELSAAVSFPSSAAALPVPSFFFLPCRSAVQAFLAVRMHLEHQQQQEQQQQSRHWKKQQQEQSQLQQQHCEGLLVYKAQHRGHQQEGELPPHSSVVGQRQRPLQQEEGRRRRSSSGESSRRGCSSLSDSRDRNVDVWRGDGCAKDTSREPERTNAVHEKMKEWDREDEDDPVLTDFSSLEREAFPYPLPCCSFFELLPPDGHPYRVSLQRLQQGIQQTLHRHCQDHEHQHRQQQDRQQQDRQQQERQQQDRQQHDRQQQSTESREATGKRNIGMLLQLQTDEEHFSIEISQERQHWLSGHIPVQQREHQTVEQQQQEVQSKQALSEQEKKRKLFFSRAYSADTDVYSELLKRHFGDQKTSTMQEGAGDEDRLRASIAHEYLTFQPPPAFEVTDLRPQTFRERLAAVQRDIESLSIPPPPRPCPLRFSKFASHAKRLTAALGAASPRFAAEPATTLQATATAAAVGSVPNASAVAVPPTAAAAARTPPQAGASGTADDAADAACAAADSRVETPDVLHAFIPGASVFTDGEGSSSSHRVRAGRGVAITTAGDRTTADVVEHDKTKGNDETNIAFGGDMCASRSDEQLRSSLRSTAAAGRCWSEASSFSATSLQAVADYFGFFACAGVRVPSLEEAVACCVAEELHEWPSFLDGTTMKALQDVLAHSKARRFNRFPCRIAWPPVPPLCTYSESNLRCSMRELVNLKTYTLVQDYYHTRFHRQTSIHNFAVDQHTIDQRKLAAAETRCRQQQQDGEKRSDETQPQQLQQKQFHKTAAQTSQNLQQELLSLEQQQTQKQQQHRRTEAGGQHVLQSSHVAVLQGQQEQQDQPQEELMVKYAKSAAAEEDEGEEAKAFVDLKFSFSSATSAVFGKCPATRRLFAQSELDVFRRVSPDEAIISVAFYHAVRGTKLAAFDVLATQTLLDIRTAFLGCCEAESEPGIPVFPGSCFLIDGILYPDTEHESSGPEYAETIAEHLSRSNKLARKVRDQRENELSGGGLGHSAAGKDVRIIRPRRRLDGSLRARRPGRPQQNSISTVLQEEQQQQQKSRIYVHENVTAKSSRNRREISGSREGSEDAVRNEDAGLLVEKETSLSTGIDGDRACEERFLYDRPVLTGAKINEAACCSSEELDDDEESNDWIVIPQHKAVLNNMQLPLRSLECFVHQGTCEHRVIFWNIRQFDPQRDCSYVAAYPVRTYKPSSKAITCQACEEYLACKGVLNSVLCSVHNPTYLCESCYTVLFGGVAGKEHGLNSVTSLGHYSCGSGKTLSSTVFDDRIAGREESSARRDIITTGSSVAEDGTAEEEDDNADPFALHFDVYDG